MGVHQTPFPAKSKQGIKPKPASKTTTREPPNSRIKRGSSGLIQNPRVPVKFEPGKPIPRSDLDDQTDRKTIACRGITAPTIDEPETPIMDGSVTRGKNVGTAYFSANSSGKCRLDRLESAGYWLDQIKLAESVGKHCVSAVFFRLAIDCDAKPLKNLRVELRRYLTRNGALGEETSWKEVSLRLLNVAIEEPVKCVRFDLRNEVSSEVLDPTIDPAPKEDEQEHPENR